MGDELEKFVQSWTIDVRHDEARQARHSSRWQKQLSVDEARFSGLLVDLYESSRPVSLTTSSGRQLSGTISEIGPDFVAITEPYKNPAYLRLDLITSLEVEGNASSVGIPSVRPLEGERNFDDVIADFAQRQAKVRFATRNAKELRLATLINAGADVITLELSTTPPKTLFVATEHLSELSES